MRSPSVGASLLPRRWRFTAAGVRSIGTGLGAGAGTAIATAIASNGMRRRSVRIGDSLRHGCGHSQRPPVVGRPHPYLVPRGRHSPFRGVLHKFAYSSGSEIAVFVSALRQNVVLRIRTAGLHTFAYARHSAMLEVTTVTVQGAPTAVGSAGPYTLVVDRPTEAGGGGAVAEGISLSHVRVTVRGDFSGAPAVSETITYDVEIEGDAPRPQLDALVRRVDEIAEIPNSLRRGTDVNLGNVLAAR